LNLIDFSITGRFSDQNYQREVSELNRKVLGLAVAFMATAMLTTSIGGVLAKPFYEDISLRKTYSMVYVEDHPELLVIDIRMATGPPSPYTYNQGHIQGAINVPVIESGSPNWAVLTAWIESEGQSHLDDKIIIYCVLGGFSPIGAQMLIDADFKKVYSMEGGYSAWAAAGYPAEL
jgi:rhodanese-related sulfurtransferase